VIDLHCHLLPGIDDGPKGLSVSLQMAQIAVSDGIRIIACTPHIQPGVYENTGPAIRSAVTQLQAELDKAEIPLLLTSGADVHIVPNLLTGLKNGSILPLGKSRYFLLEPPQGLAPPRFESFVFGLVAAGYIPIITHPERLSWIEGQYAMLERTVRQGGAWTQLTGNSILGKFGRRARYWSERMLDEGLVHIIATDAHNTDQRPPLLSEAVAAIEKQISPEEARHMVITRPAGVLRNADPADLPLPGGRISPRAQTGPR
jgi:protein-tyrosine phosphatase